MQWKRSRDTLQKAAETDEDAKEALEVLEEYNQKRPSKVKDRIALFSQYLECIRNITRSVQVFSR